MPAAQRRVLALAARGAAVANPTLQEFLTQERNNLVEAWKGAVFALFPAEALPYLKKKKDPYMNPLAHTLASGLEELFDELLGLGRDEAIDQILTRMIKTLAIQNQEASASLSFIFLLRKVLGRALAAAGQPELLGDLEPVLEALLKRGINILVATREAIADLKINEMERKTYSLIKLVNRQQHKADHPLEA